MAAAAPLLAAVRCVNMRIGCLTDFLTSCHWHAGRHSHVHGPGLFLPGVQPAHAAPAPGISVHLLPSLKAPPPPPPPPHTHTPFDAAST